MRIKYLYKNMYIGGRGEKLICKLEKNSNPNVPPAIEKKENGNEWNQRSEKSSS
jgi:hypothetical protein